MGIKNEILSIALSKRKFFYIKKISTGHNEIETVNSNQKIGFINNEKELVITNFRFKIQYWHLQDLIETIDELMKNKT